MLDGTQWARLLRGELDWGDMTVPQSHLDGRVLPNVSGRLSVGAQLSMQVGKHPCSFVFEIYSSYGQKGEHFVDG